MMNRRQILLGALLLGLSYFSQPQNAAAQSMDDKLWAEIRKGGVAILMRHALAPGTGDPANLKIGDCSTQRNLNDVGRAQARRIGAKLRANGVSQATVYSSQWCRCVETARLLGLGAVAELPAANSFFRDRSTGPRQTRELRDFIARSSTGKVLVIVTHQVNITALTNVFPASGEIIVVRPDAEGPLKILGRNRTR